MNLVARSECSLSVGDVLQSRVTTHLMNILVAA